MDTRPAWRTFIGFALRVACFTCFGLLLLAACQQAPTDVPNMVNPASAFCEEQGNKVEIRTAPDGSQSGVCVFPDGSECDEWAYFRGECAPGGAPPPPTPTPPEGAADWMTYGNKELGYTFQYPPGAEITPGDDPLESLIISGTGMGDASWGISHPAGQEAFRPPEGADLEQWLTEHNMLGETRLPDAQIAGLTAIHLRHERSPQSYANDRYYFVKGTQLYQVIIGHGEVEDWDSANRFLQSWQFK